MEIFPRRKIEARLGITFLACLLFSVPFLVTRRALIAVPVIFALGAAYYLGIYYPKYRKRRIISKFNKCRRFW